MLRFTNKYSFMMKYLSVFIFLLIMSFGVSAQSNEQLIAEANKAYTEGKYKNTIELYEKILNSGSESYELYYNLGNAHFKMNNIPSAIFYYEKALELKPNDENTEFNLKIANSKIIDKIEEVPAPFYKKGMLNASNLFTVNIWAVIIIVSFIVFLLLVITYLISLSVRMRKLSFWTAVLVLLLFLSFNYFAYNQHSRVKSSFEAIVFDPSVNVKSSPDEKSTDIFVIHDGTKVKVRDRVGDWVEIYIANGSIGWIKASAIKEI